MPSVPSRWTTTRRKPICWLARPAAAATAATCRGGTDAGAGCYQHWALCCRRRSSGSRPATLGRRRDVGQPLLDQPSPTVLAKEHIVGVRRFRNART